MKKLYIMIIGIACFLVSPNVFASGKVQDGLYLTYEEMSTLRVLEQHKNLRKDGVYFEYYDNGDVRNFFPIRMIG